MEEAGQTASDAAFEYPVGVLRMILGRIFHGIADGQKAAALDGLLRRVLMQFGDVRFHAYTLFPYTPSFVSTASPSAGHSEIAREGRAGLAPDAFDALLARILALLTEVEVAKRFRQALVRLPATWTKKTPLKCRADHRSAYTQCWLQILAMVPAGSASLHRRILGVLDEAVIPQMTRAQLLADYLTDAYNAGGILSLLALGSLFTLIRRHNLDYPSFYEKLYSLLDRRILHIGYRKRFLTLLNTFMQSTMLPAYLVAAFLKRIARLALFAPPASILWVLPFCYNLLKQHPPCRVMIHREAPASLQDDPYNPEEASLAACGALQSSLWELQTLTRHHAAQVSRLASIFSERFTKPLYDLEPFLDAASHAEMAEAELGHRWSKRPPTNIAIPSRAFD